MTNTNKLAESGYPVFLGSEIQQSKFDEAFFHVLPVPYEASVSYGGGTSRAPESILAASWQLEVWDGKSKPSDMGVYTHEPVSVKGCAQEVMNNIAQATQEIVSRNKFPLVIGGEHSVSFGVINGFLNSGMNDIGVVQIDAHADLRESYEGNPYSHASVMKRIVDKEIPLFQLGVRALCEEEIAHRQRCGVYYLDADELVPKGQMEFELPESFPANVFFTLDVDGVDPSVFPSTGTPVPGGLGWYQTLSLFECVARQRNIVGFDLMEFSPISGFHAYDFSAALLIQKMMGIVQRCR